MSKGLLRISLCMDLNSVDIPGLQPRIYLDRKYGLFLEFP